MARDHARIKIDIWADDDFGTLSHSAQWLYLYLLSSPTLNFAGVTDYRPARISGRSPSLTAELVEEYAAELEAGEYIIVDRKTEQVLIRSFVKHDGLLRSPNMAKALTKEYLRIESRTLRAVLVGQLLTLQEQSPELKGWAFLGDVLANRSITPAEAFEEMGTTHRETHQETLPNPSAKGSPKGSGKGSGTPVLLSSSPPVLPNSRSKREPFRSREIDPPTRFDEFWNRYPRKVGKDKARTAYESACNRADEQTVIDGAIRLAADPNLPERQFIPHPTTWLNRGGWDDEPYPPRTSDQRPNRVQQNAEVVRQMAAKEQQQRLEIEQ